MNVDTQFQHALPPAAPTRSVHQQPDQASARPVERPHHAEPADNDTRQRATEKEPPHNPRQPSAGERVRQQAEPPDPEKREAENLQARDREVRAHEAGHKAPVGELLDVIV
jgi:hypothetical protein